MKHIKHLVILQKGTEDGGSVETVSSAVIAALYNLSQDELLVYDLNDLKGDLLCTATYLRYIDSLHAQYPKLNITALSYYMFFLDPVIEQYWANSEYGDGTGISASAASSVTSFPTSGNGYGTIGQFYGNTNITSFDELNLFVNIKTIPHGCFWGSTNLTSIGLNNIERIDSRAFYKSGLTGIINIPNLKTFGDLGGNGTLLHANGGQFSSCTNITQVNLSSNIDDNYKIVTLPTLCFWGCSLLQSVTGLSLATSLPSRCFCLCTSLTSLPDLTNKVTTLSDRVFNDCTSLKCIDLTNVTSAGDVCFGGCSDLIALDTNDESKLNDNDTYTIKVSSISADLFVNTKLTNKNIIFPNALTLTGFRGSLVKSLSAPQATALTNLGLQNCNNLLTISVGTLSSAGDYCCMRSSNLSDISASNITKVYNPTTDLIEVTINNADIGNQAFQGCTNLWRSCTIEDTSQTPSVTITKNVHLKFTGTSTIKQTALQSTGIRACTLYPAITAIPSSLFADCNNLTTFDFTGITSIGSSAFSKTPLSGDIVFPNTIASIGANAFNACNNITSYTFESTTPPTFASPAYSMFGTTYSNGLILRPIYVPDSAVLAYLEALPTSGKYNESVLPISQKPS